MSKRTSISNSAPGTAEKQASAAQPAKQGRWGWPLRSQVDVSKPPSNPTGVGSGSSTRTPSILGNSDVESVSPAQSGTPVPNLPAEISSPQPTKANSGMLAQILDREAEQASVETKPPRSSISSERPLQSQLPLSRPASLNVADGVNAPNPVGTQNPPNNKPVPPVTDPKSPKRTWPPVQTRTKSQDSIHKEDAPFSSSRKSSASTLSTRRSSRNLPTWPPVSSSPADARDVEPNRALSLPRSRNSIVPEDNKPTQEKLGSASADQASFPSSSAKGDRIGDEVDGEAGKTGPQTVRIPEAIQKPHEQVAQTPLSQIPGSFPTRSDSTFAASLKEEPESASVPSGSSTSLSPVPEMSKPVRAGHQGSEGKAPAVTSHASDAPEANLRKASYETEKNPWDDESILRIGDVRQTPAETKLAKDSSLDPIFPEREPGPGKPETQIHSAARKGSDLNAKDSEPKASEYPKNDKRVKFAGVDRDSSSSGSTTPTEQASHLPKRPVAEELAPLNSDTALQAPNGIKEPTPPANGQVGNENTTAAGTANSSAHNQFLPLLGHETRHEGYSAGPTLAPQSDVSLEDLSSVQGIKSMEPSLASSSADSSITKGETPLATPVKPETTFSEPTQHSPQTDQTEKLPEPNSTRTLDKHRGSFEAVESHSGLANVEGRVLDLIIGVQAEVRQKGNPRLSNDIPKLETVRTVVEIPSSFSTDKRLSIPKIHVQNPTEVTEPEVAPRKTASRSNSLNTPRSLQSAVAGASGRRPTLPGTPPAFIASKPAEDPVTNEEPKLPPLKKRKLYIRKVRNVAARKIILEITLGRELAGPTKRRLRKLATGEDVGTESEQSGVKTEEKA